MSDWYAMLIKPAWAPPAWLFGPAWSFLYVLIVISFSQVLVLAWRKKIKFKVWLPFALNLFFNFLFTPVQFGLRNNILSALVITLLLGTLIWAIFAIYPYKRWVAYLQIPYLTWVILATALQFSVSYLNR